MDMSKLDGLFSKAKDLARAAGSKTEEVVELTKLKMQAGQLKSDIDANYLKLGEIIYELNRAGTENEALVNMCIAEIEVQLKELEALNEKIDRMRNVRKCPECMAANAVDSLFCARCGASLKGQPITQATAEEVDQLLLLEEKAGE